jgi:hypothetical protein
MPDPNDIKRDANLGGDYARDTHREGFGDDYARESNAEGTGARGDNYGADARPTTGAVEHHEEPIGKASE